MAHEFVVPLLPKSFDKNEWYILIIAISMVLAFLFIPKRFPFEITLNIILFNLFLSFVVDHLLAMPPHDFYDIIDKPSFEIFDLINYIFLYSIFGYFLLYVYDLLHLNLSYKKTFIFIVTSALIATCLEAISTNFFDVFTYYEWKLIYSFVSYVFLFLFSVLYYRWFIFKE
jgi:hypothetical protein